MKLISPALLIEALALRYTDSNTLLSAEVFADFVTDYAKEEGFDIPGAEVVKAHYPAEPARAAADIYLDTLRAQGLSPTGRRPSQPEFQSLRPSTRPMWECSETQPGPAKPFISLTARCAVEAHTWVVYTDHVTRCSRCKVVMVKP
jgi:hypothetical protein